MEALFEKYQKQLLAQARSIYSETPLSEATQRAYLETPRHLFVKRYRDWGSREWHEVNEEHLEEHLAVLYADRPLILFGEDDENIPSTISQPSFMLRMLDMLQLEPGQKVFELGTGSGWNAALLGHLVGPEGRVYSLEIIPEVAQRAAETIKQLNIKNVRIIEADGGAGYAAGAPYDRAIFTAGTYDLPHHFFEQMKENSLLLLVIKNEGGGDTLFLLRKRDTYFESIESLPCGFVQMTGKYQMGSLAPIDLENLLELSSLKDQEVARRPFWWGSRGKWQFKQHTLGIRSFLSIIEPLFCTITTKKSSDGTRKEEYFGVWDQENHSLVIAKDDTLISYGNLVAEERLMQDVRQWVELGMPSAVSFELKIYPIGSPLSAADHQWLVKRNESQFLWSLNI